MRGRREKGEGRREKGEGKRGKEKWEGEAGRKIGRENENRAGRGARWLTGERWVKSAHLWERENCCEFECREKCARDKNFERSLLSSTFSPLPLHFSLYTFPFSLFPFPFLLFPSHFTLPSKNHTVRPVFADHLFGQFAEYFDGKGGVTFRERV